MATAMAALIVEPNASLSVLGDRASRSTHARTCRRGARGASRSVRQPLCRFRFIAAAARGSRGGTLCAVRRRIVNGDDGCVLFVRRCRAEPGRCMLHVACCMLHAAGLCCTPCGVAVHLVRWLLLAEPRRSRPRPVQSSEPMAWLGHRSEHRCFACSRQHCSVARACRVVASVCIRRTCRAALLHVATSDMPHVNIAQRARLRRRLRRSAA